jgi:hypothetical protein
LTTAAPGFSRFPRDRRAMLEVFQLSQINGAQNSRIEQGRKTCSTRCRKEVP